jgi:serine/threonine protein kinase
MAKKAKRPINERKIRRVMRDICLGLKDLHKRKIIHLDIKPENVLVSNSKKYKLGDLGLARLVTKLAGDVPEGDSRYLAPELLNEDPTAVVPDLTKADIFSLGIMTYELMRNRPLPLNGDEWHDIREGRADLKGLESYSKELIELILLMLQNNPVERPSAEKILDEYLLSPEQIEIKQLKMENELLKQEIARLKELHKE